MALRILQVKDANGSVQVVAAGDEGAGHVVSRLFLGLRPRAGRGGARSTLAEEVERAGKGASVDLDAALAEGRILMPIHHPDPAHFIVAGTGLTHLGSADGRDKMHKAQAGEQLTDSMRMFRMGLEGGKPAEGEIGVQPEWFYKGDGSCLVGPGDPLTSPSSPRTAARSRNWPASI